jgi:protein-glutamine gamma-glutamyltransferase
VTGVVERQRWMAAFALAVAAPLPLTGIVGWPFMLPYLAVAAWVAASRRPLAPLPAWAENALAIAIVAVVAAAGGVRYGVLRPVAQLAVLVAAVRLPGCGRPGRARLTGGVVALVGVAGVASSTHPALAPYLVALLAFVVVAAGRLTALGLADRAARARPWRSWRLVAATVVTAVLVAAPLFALLPRLRSPFAAGPFAGRPTSGFRSLVGLRGIGDISLSRRIVMRVRFPGVAPGRVSPDWLRLAGATLSHYRAGGWVESKLRGERLTVREGRPVVLADRPATARDRRVEITLEREGDTLFLPLGAVAVTSPPGVALVRAPSGTLRVAHGTPLPIDYSAQFDPALVVQPQAKGADLELPPGSDRMRELAQRITGRTTNRLAAALALEQYLQAHYAYSLATRAPLREDPVQWFLFSSRRGHCEFFASSMVLLLRTLGIPARLQVGYAGGEGEGDGSFLVRESNAHAWVVAEVEGRWRVFDPTPPQGRPPMLPGGGAFSLADAWNRIEGAWDRWVLTFSMTDQLDLAAGVVAAVRAARPYLPAASAAAAGAALLLALARRSRARRARIVPERGAPAITDALRRAMKVGGRRGLEVGPGTTVRSFARAAALAFPAAGEPLSWLAREHERCRYAGGPTPQRRDVRRAARLAVRALRAR